MFGLDPVEVDILQMIKNKKRNFLNPHDPFFTKYRGHYKISNR